jgi:hypothetical protein
MQSEEQKKAEGKRFDEYEKKKREAIEAKLYKMDDQRLLCELAIAYGNTDDADLGSYHRRNLMTVFADLNLDHMEDYPCDTKEGSDKKHG